MLRSEHFNHFVKTTQKIESKQRDCFSATFISPQEFSLVFSCKDTVYEMSLASMILK